MTLEERARAVYVASIETNVGHPTMELIAAAIQAAVEEEREACALLVEYMCAGVGQRIIGTALAAGLRVRRNPDARTLATAEGDNAGLSEKPGREP